MDITTWLISIELQAVSSAGVIASLPSSAIPTSASVLPTSRISLLNRSISCVSTISSELPDTSPLIKPARPSDGLISAGTCPAICDEKLASLCSSDSPPEEPL